jgi:hypothetical protein
MAGYVANIEQETLRNEDFRRVLFTGPNSQFVVMSLRACFIKRQSFQAE